MLYGKKWLAVLAIVVLAFLPACGGGGGGGNGGNPPIFDSIEPVANAGPDQEAKVGDPVLLDGSGSTNPSGGLLTYAWLFTSKPVDSEAILSNAGVVNPTFVADEPGGYQLILTVNDGIMSNESSPVTINVTTVDVNAPPVADAGNDRTVDKGSTVTLDGSKSYDADGDPISYSWSFDSQLSGTFLPSNTVVAPSFIANEEGLYVVRLTVSDGKSSSEDTVNITVFTPSPVNNPPVAVASVSDPAGPVAVNEIVTLDGSGSSDPDGNPLSYSWIFKSRPTGSLEDLTGANEINPTFTPDRAGIYEVTLTVSDGALDNSATISVEASYVPLFTVGGLLIPVTPDPPDGFYIAGTVITPIIRNDSSLNFILRNVDLLSQSQSDPVFSTPALDKPLTQGESLFIDFELENDEKIPVDGIVVRFNLELLETAEKFTIKYSYDTDSIID